MQEHLENLKRELENGTAQLLDVREQDEWDEGHLQRASLAPLSELNQGEEPAGPDKSKKTYLHCRSGNRVHVAAPLLREMGYKEVIPLDEGYEELLGEGFLPADG